MSLIPYSVDTSVLVAAREIRAELLSRPTAERGLGGQCALASMRLAETIGIVAAFRVGYFMRQRARYRYPHHHAWCQVGGTIVDITATQFGRFPAIYVVAALATDRYVEHADGAQAIALVMREWQLEQKPEYRSVRRKLRALDDAVG